MPKILRYLIKVLTSLSNIRFLASFRRIEESTHWSDFVKFFLLKCKLHIFMNRIPWLTASKCRVPNCQDLSLNTLIVIRLFLKLESYTYYYDDISSLSNKYPISNSLFSFGNSFMCVVFLIGLFVF